MSDETKGVGRIAPVVSAAGLAVICFLFGAYTARFEVAPFPQVVEPYFHTLVSPGEARLNRVGAPTPPARWNPAALSGTGVVERERGRHDTGAILYSSADAAHALLVDRSGERLHRWSKPFAEVWRRGSGSADGGRGDEPFWSHVELLSEGHLLASYSVTRGVPYGRGLVKLDADSRVVWRYGGRTHHDFEVGPGGAVYALVHEMHRGPVGGLKNLPDEFLEDGVVKLSPTGQRLKRFSLVEAFARSEYRGAIQMHPTTLESDREKEWDVLHANSLSIVGESFARHHPFADPGDLLISCRTPDIVALVDPAEARVQWATRGYWWQPTDARPASSGRIVVFDSNGHGGEGFPSRLLAFDPATNRTPWLYEGTTQNPFWAVQGGTVQLLPGGNLLATSPRLGRIREVTRDGVIVWEYRNPTRRREAGSRQVAALWSGRRVPVEDLEFLEESG